MSKSETLPQEIVNDILFRLPAKSIGQCRCVSKQWCSLLSDPQFITIHAHKEVNEEKVLWISNSHSLHTIPLNGTAVISRKLNFQQLPDNWATVVGSCNGLVLMQYEDNIHFLINPTTLKYYRIPMFHLALPVCKSLCIFGLGYDFSNDDYKVVTLSHYVFDGPDDGTTFVDIYSARNNLWRRVESSPFDHARPATYSGVFVNGALHWLARKVTLMSTDDLYIIVAFNLSDEKFLELPAPVTPPNTAIVCYDLVALRGCLCMHTATRETKIDVWMMKEYGVEESWTKFEVRGPDSLYGFYPVCLMSDSDVVLELLIEGKLIVYNMKEDQWRDTVVGGTIIAFKSTGTFIESLVSPTFGEGN